MIDLRFLLRKGLRKSIIEKFTPDDMLQTAKVDGLSFYHWKALPPADERYPDGRETYDMSLNLQGNVAIDVGAHIGSYALRLAKNFRTVYAFEPSPENFYILEMNIKRNHLEKTVLPLRLAVSDETGTATMNFVRGKPFASTLEQKHYGLKFSGSQLVTKVALDDYFQMSWRGVGSIGFVKIDAEGHEFSVLKGMEKIIAKHHPTLSVEIHHEPERPNGCDCEVCLWLRERYARTEGVYRSGEIVHWMKCYS